MFWRICPPNAENVAEIKLNNSAEEEVWQILCWVFEVGGTYSSCTGQSAYVGGRSALLLCQVLLPL